MGIYKVTVAVGSESHKISMGEDFDEFQNVKRLKFNSKSDLLQEFLNVSWLDSTYVLVEADQCTCREIVLSQIGWITSNMNFCSGFFYPVSYTEIIEENGMRLSAEIPSAIELREKLKRFNEVFFSSSSSLHRFVFRDNRVFLATRNTYTAGGRRVLYNTSLLLWLVRHHGFLDIILEKDWSNSSPISIFSDLMLFLSKALLHHFEYGTSSSPIVALSFFCYATSKGVSMENMCNGPVNASAYVSAKVLLDYLSTIYTVEIPEESWQNYLGGMQDSAGTLSEAMSRILTLVSASRKGKES